MVHGVCVHNLKEGNKYVLHKMIKDFWNSINIKSSLQDLNVAQSNEQFNKLLCSKNESIDTVSVKSLYTQFKHVWKPEMKSNQVNHQPHRLYFNTLDKAAFFTLHKSHGKAKINNELVRLFVFWFPYFWKHTDI